MNEKRILKDLSLKAYNTFGIDVKAKFFFEAITVDDLLWIIHQEEFKGPKLILGGGSNMLLTGDFEGLVIKISFKEKWIEKSDGDYTLVSVMGGENWHNFVQWTLQHNLGGLENLSLIPGNVGTAPVQNIGAYGVELKDNFHHLEALNLESGEFEIFRKEDCDFAYRHSFFKGEGKGKYIITRVFFMLTNANHRLNTSYGSIDRELESMGVEANIHNIAQAVINIRRAKLPDPAVLGNSGSFFKNPVISNSQFEILRQQFPDIIGYPAGENHTKLAAGWLIEKAGFKGLRRGDAGVHQNQALVLVNHGSASGGEIQSLANEIKEAIKRTFAVELEEEINLISSES